MSDRDENRPISPGRRQFVVKSASGIAGAIMSTYGMTWGDLAYGQQMKGQAAELALAVRPDWTQGWFGMINEEKGIWKKYLPAGSKVSFSHPIQGGIVTSELVSVKRLTTISTSTARCSAIKSARSSAIRATVSRFASSAASIATSHSRSPASDGRGVSGSARPSSQRLRAR